MCHLGHVWENGSSRWNRYFCITQYYHHHPLTLSHPPPPLSHTHNHPFILALSSYHPPPIHPEKPSRYWYKPQDYFRPKFRESVPLCAALHLSAQDNTSDQTKRTCSILFRSPVTGTGPQDTSDPTERCSTLFCSLVIGTGPKNTSDQTTKKEKKNKNKGDPLCFALCLWWWNSNLAKTEKQEQMLCFFDTLVIKWAHCQPDCR